MTKNKYIVLIFEQLSALKIYNESYKTVIETLAATLEQRDKTFKEFKKSGGLTVIEYTNKNGSKNKIKNPLLVMWDELNKTALAYWRELGLTPSAYKKITGDGGKKETSKKGLAAALEKIEV